MHLARAAEPGLHPVATADVIDNQPKICGDCPARSGGFCSYHGDAALTRFARSSKRVAMSRNETLETNDFVIVTKGVLNAVHYGKDGKQKIVGVTMLGEAIVPGELSENAKAVAATPVVICRIRRASYQEALNHSHDFRKHIYLQARAKRDRARYLAFAIGHLGPEQRIAAFYASCTSCMPWQPMPDGGGILSMEYERQDIAALLATTVETVCRVLHRLEGSGMIRLRDARHIQIRNLAEFRAHGGLAAPQAGEGFAPCTVRFPLVPRPMITVNAAIVAHC